MDKLLNFVGYANIFHYLFFMGREHLFHLALFFMIFWTTFLVESLTELSDTADPRLTHAEGSKLLEALPYASFGVKERT